MVFFNPGYRLEHFLRGTKILTGKLRGMKFFGKNIRGTKFLTVNHLRGMKFSDDDEF